MVVYFALQCVEKLILEGKSTIEVLHEPYVRYNELVDEGNKTKSWADPRAANYYWTKYGRSATQNPFTGQEMWSFLHYPDYGDMQIA
jgi:4-hydroxyacetophenone monooxygenase